MFNFNSISVQKSLDNYIVVGNNSTRAIGNFATIDDETMNDIINVLTAHGIVLREVDNVFGETAKKQTAKAVASNIPQFEGVSREAVYKDSEGGLHVATMHCIHNASNNKLSKVGGMVSSAIIRNLPNVITAKFESKNGKTYQCYGYLDESERDNALNLAKSIYSKLDISDLEESKVTREELDRRVKAILA